MTTHLRQTSSGGPAREVQFDERGLVIDSVPTGIIGGALEFWRVNSVYWRRSLRLMKSSGLEQVSTFVCWDFHQVETGELDFVGKTHPSRDLAGFLDLCQEEGLDVILRIGPIIDAEWPTRGPAEDVCRLERFDPLYRSRSSEYVRALLEVVEARQATHGGPIVLLGLDNEPAVPYYTDNEPLELQAPYRREEIVSRYRGWLAETYKSDDRLREAWDDVSARIEDVSEPDYTIDGRASRIDSCRFMTAVLIDHYLWLKSEVRTAGIGIPVFSNMRQFSHHVGWDEVEDVMDSVGMGLFLGNMVPGDQALVVSWSIRLHRATMRFPWAAEMQSMGTVRRIDTLGGLSERHHAYLTELAIGLGLRGLAYYVFVERDDALYAPVSQLGLARPQLAHLTPAIALAKQMTPDEQLCDVGLLWSRSQHREASTARLQSWLDLGTTGMELAAPKEAKDWWVTFSELHEADTDFAIVPMDRGAAKGDRATPSILIYAGDDVVDSREWTSIAARVEEDALTLVLKALPTSALDHEDGLLQSANARLLSTNRVIFADSLGKETLERAGATWFVRSTQANIWTMAYESESRHLICVMNVGNERRQVTLDLGEALLVVGSPWHQLTGDTDSTYTPTDTGKIELPEALGPNELLVLARSK
jgi:hypothetical protein